MSQLKLSRKYVGVQLQSDLQKTHPLMGVECGREAASAHWARSDSCIAPSGLRLVYFVDEPAAQQQICLLDC